MLCQRTAPIGPPGDHRFDDLCLIPAASSAQQCADVATDLLGLDGQTVVVVGAKAALGAHEHDTVAVHRVVGTTTAWATWATWATWASWRRSGVKRHLLHPKMESLDDKRQHVLSRGRSRTARRPGRPGIPRRTRAAPPAYHGPDRQRTTAIARGCPKAAPGAGAPARLASGTTAAGTTRCRWCRQSRPARFGRGDRPTQTGAHPGRRARTRGSRRTPPAPGRHGRRRRRAVRLSSRTGVLAATRPSRCRRLPE